MRTVQLGDRVRFVETDMMGVVHHSNHFRWFEMGRVEFLRQAGIELLDLMGDGIVFPISDVECKYLIPARFDDEIVIEAQLPELSRVKLVFHYRILRPRTEEVLAVGRTISVFTNREGRIIRLPQTYMERLESFVAVQE